MQKIYLNDLELSEIGIWPPLLKIAAIVIIAIGTFTICYLMLLQGQFATLESLRSQQATLTKTFSHQYSQVINLPSYQQQNQLLSAHYHSLTEKMPQTQDINSVFKQITQLATDNNLQYDSIIPSNTTSLQFYQELPVTITAIGTYHNLAAFLEALTTLPHIITLQRLIINNNQHLNNNFKENLQIKIHAKAYYAKEDAI